MKSRFDKIFKKSKKDEKSSSDDKREENAIRSTRKGDVSTHRNDFYSHNTKSDGISEHKNSTTDLRNRNFEKDTTQLDIERQEALKRDWNEVVEMFNALSEPLKDVSDKAKALHYFERGKPAKRNEEKKLQEQKDQQLHDRAEELYKNPFLGDKVVKDAFKLYGAKDSNKSFNQYSKLFASFNQAYETFTDSSALAHFKENFSEFWNKYPEKGKEKGANTLRLTQLWLANNLSVDGTALIVDSSQSSSVGKTAEALYAEIQTSSKTGKEKLVPKGRTIKEVLTDMKYLKEPDENTYKNVLKDLDILGKKLNNIKSKLEESQPKAHLTRADVLSNINELESLFKAIQEFCKPQELPLSKPSMEDKVLFVGKNEVLAQAYKEFQDKRSAFINSFNILDRSLNDSTSLRERLPDLKWFYKGFSDTEPEKLKEEREFESLKGVHDFVTTRRELTNMAQSLYLRQEGFRELVEKHVKEMPEEE